MKHKYSSTTPDLGLPQSLLPSKPELKERLSTASSSAWANSESVAKLDLTRLVTDALWFLHPSRSQHRVVHFWIESIFLPLLPRVRSCNLLFFIHISSLLFSVRLSSS